MSKLFISDIDGTLLPRGEKRLSGGVLTRLSRIYKSGIAVAISSGRSYDSIKAAFGGNMPSEVYIISCDGALTSRDGKALYGKPLSVSSVNALFAHAKKTGGGFFCTAFDSYVYGSDPIFDGHPAFSAGDKVIKSVYDLKEPVYKIGIAGENSLPFPLPCDVRLAYDDGHLREYISRYADKGTALLDLQGRTFAFPEDTFASGDGENDLCMMKKAKISASVGNCDERVKEGSLLHFASAEEMLDNYIASNTENII